LGAGSAKSEFKSKAIWRFKASSCCVPMDNLLLAFSDVQIRPKVGFALEPAIRFEDERRVCRQGSPIDETVRGPATTTIKTFSRDQEPPRTMRRAKNGG
jgi:hypothetical protein